MAGTKLQNFKGLENEKSFLDEIKSIVHNYLKVYHLVKKWKIADTTFKKVLRQRGTSLWETQ